MPLPARILAALATAGLLAGCNTTGQSPAREYGYVQTVRSGVKTLAGDYNTLSGDGVATCHGQALPEVRVTQAPAHGQLAISTAIRPLTVESGRALSYCRNRAFPTVLVHYRSEPGFRGQDSGAYAVRYGNGETEVYRKVFEVR